jgi:8-oxo-dGTP pyrophosphatase MutT (NUDIX family)
MSQLSEKRWTRLSSKVQVDALPYLRLRQDHVRLPNGAEIDNFFVCEYSDWVGVIPITPEGQVVMVSQYRYAIDQISLEFPAGMVYDQEDTLEAAKRELLEETGYESAEWIKIGAWFPEPSRHTNRAYFYIAQNAVQTQAIQPEDTEDIEVTLMDPQKVEFHVIHAIHLAAWYKARFENRI